MNGTYIRLLWLAVAGCAGVLSCSTQRTTPLAGGGSSETVIGAVVGPNGAPCAGALVRIRQNNYLTPLPTLGKQAGIISVDAITDSTGRFCVRGIEPGSYRIEVSDTNSRYGVLFECLIAEGDTVNLGTDTLRPYGVVMGAVDTGAVSGTQRFVQVAGLERLVLVAHNGYYALADLPAGLFTLRIGSAAPGGPLFSVSDVPALPGDTSIASSPLPPPWRAASIGDETPRGGAMYLTGRFVIAGGGPDIWDSADGFHFVYQPWSGDGEIVARLAAFRYGVPYSKAAVMFRETLDPAAVNVTASIERDSSGADVFCIHYRRQASGPSVVACGVYGYRAPQWVRLVRSGNAFTAAVSPDGTTWTETCSTTVTMTREALVGLAVSSHNRTRLATAEFENVTVK